MTFVTLVDERFQAEGLTDVVYDVDWYNATGSKIPRHIMFMLMKAQRPLRLTGAGLFNVDRSMFLQVSKILLDHT